MCHQAAETWLTPFSQQISRQWDITNLHINKNNAAGIEADLDHYWNTYGKPMWITEVRPKGLPFLRLAVQRADPVGNSQFACVDDSTGFTPCTDQNQINSFIWTAVGIFEADTRVAGYAYSNGEGLGDVWPMMNGGQLRWVIVPKGNLGRHADDERSESGKTYLAAISAHH